MNDSLKGKKVLITGASGGIGFAMAKAFAAAGSRVILSATNEQKLENAYKILIDEFSEEVFTYRSFDLNNEQEIDSFYAAIDNEVEGIDILICNAGINRDSIGVRMSDTQWEEVLKVNLNAVFKLNRAALKFMIKKRYGRIINITSIIGHTGNIGQANYAASKAAVNAMTKSLALEVAGRGITINCISPGFIETAMTEKLSDTIREKIMTQIPMSRFGVPADVAGAALFLASSLASYITGSTIHVNGGMLMV